MDNAPADTRHAISVAPREEFDRNAMPSLWNALFRGVTSDAKRRVRSRSLFTGARASFRMAIHRLPDPAALSSLVRRSNETR
jgi:hypothetical protein